ncbi:hypothetical protein FGG08_003352 [Glutinoglossum americanum]|uniref:DNA-directed DNA polymerase n=1 Tax=Glutinoglossum americanum TaxID=1670608 RepID=A0A9P8IB72_9PEZI|nr:hypothetical protein FGG08_003352 [Glutinoglossum americanum]
MATDRGDDGGDGFLRDPSGREYPVIARAPSSYNPLQTFHLDAEKHYQQQYADLYFLRLAKLKPSVEDVAAEAWDGFQIGGELVRRVERVLDVRQGELCWVAGTVYMDMPLKPNILDDISKDHWISAPAPREKYISSDGSHRMMLEDVSGRLRLTGAALEGEILVTGCIIAVMGTENANGDFDVVDMRFPDLPRQPQRWERDDINAATKGASTKSREARPDGTKVAILSGLGIKGDEAEGLRNDIFMEWLLGEASGESEQAAVSKISRLILAGNSLAEAAPIPSRDELAGKKHSKKYGYDSSAYNPAPTSHLDNLLSTLLPSVPITLIPGATDPANVSLPQQPIHAAMFPLSRAYAAPPGQPQAELPDWFHSATNPWEGDVDGWRMLGTGGQPVDDIFKYVEGDDRLAMMERMLRWRCVAPTAPDTLWCYPFQDKDQFVLEECPHVFFVGNQPRFETALISGPAGQTVRLIAVPRFKETGEVILLDTETLDVESVRFEIFDKGDS